jgi:hypothetical protein
MPPRVGSTGWRVRRRVFALVARRASLCSCCSCGLPGHLVRRRGKLSTSLISAFKRGPTFAPWHLGAANRRLLSLEPRRAPRSSLGRGLSLRSIKRDRPALPLTAKSTLGGGFRFIRQLQQRAPHHAFLTQTEDGRQGPRSRLLPSPATTSAAPPPSTYSCTHVVCEPWRGRPGAAVVRRRRRCWERTRGAKRFRRGSGWFLQAEHARRLEWGLCGA